MNIVKNMNKVSLFLLGLVVAFGVTSCGCDKGSKNPNSVKQGATATFSVKFKADANEDAVLVAPAFEENGKTLAQLGKPGAVRKDGTRDIEIKAKDDAAEGKTVIKFTKTATDKTEVAELEVTIIKK